MAQEKEGTRIFHAQAKRLTRVTAPWKTSAKHNTRSSAGGGGAGEEGCDLLFPTLSGRAGLVQMRSTKGRGEAARGAGFAPLSSAKKAAE